MPPVAQSIVGSARMSLWFGEQILKDIKPEQFARKPKGIDTNHPAWVFGHLAVYPDKSLFPLIGRPELAQPSDDFNALFGHQSKCEDDPKGAIYPAMESITSRFLKRTDAFLRTLAETDDAALLKPLPKDHFLADKVQNIAGALNFMLSAHTMMHFGQVSAWRRAMGLGPCIG